MTSPKRQSDGFWLNALIALAVYLSVVGTGVFGIVTLAEKSAGTALNVAKAVTEVAAIREARANFEATPRVLRVEPHDPRREPVHVESDAFDHARTSPMLFERADRETIDDLKRAVDERIVTDDASPWHHSDRTTFKTMCVRLCDGAYFPISFATTRRHFARDEAVCASRCGMPARLFVFPNPGGTPDMMRDRSGHSYLALPSAFQFRKGAVEGCTCKAKPWEVASRERHRMYALEEKLAAGKLVDMAELTSLRSRYATRVVAKASPRTGTVRIPVAVHAPPRVEVAPLAPQITTSAVEVPEAVGRPVAPATDTAAGSVRRGSKRTLLEHVQPSAEIAALQPGPGTDGNRIALPEPVRLPPIPAKSSLERPDGEPTPAPARFKLRRDRKPVLYSKTKRGLPGRLPEDDEPAMVSPVKKISVGVTRNEIWGVGRNAHGAPRGGSAFEVFARNFY